MISFQVEIFRDRHPALKCGIHWYRHFYIGEGILEMYLHWMQISSIPVERLADDIFGAAG